MTNSLIQHLTGSREVNRISHAERLVSALGGFCGIFAIYLVSRQFLAGADTALIVASMGASAVLLFAVPHSALAQPWPVFGGHLVSALVGVSCAAVIPDTWLAAAAAVGLAIGAMHYLRCIHPPGGATALAAVVGGPAVHALGYQFVVTPVLLNVVTIVLVAIAFNYPFVWRRYPAALANPRKGEAAPEGVPEPGTTLGQDDLAYAVSAIDSFIDVTEADLAHIFELATRHQRRARLSPAAIRLGHYYSNGRYGEDWAVRRVLDEAGSSGDPDEQLIYKVVAGAGRRTTGTTTRGEFARWAVHEVERDENSWRRAGEDTHAS